MFLMDRFHDGGFAMYLVLAFGLVLLGVSVKYALEPESRLVPLLLSLGGLTFFSGAFGFVTGLVVTLHAVGQVPAEERFIALIGLGESLNNLALAFLLMTASTLLVVVGAYRLAQKLAPAPAAG